MQHLGRTVLSILFLALTAAGAFAADVLPCALMDARALSARGIDRHLVAWAAGILGTTLVAIGIWVITLRRALQARTAALRSTEDRYGRMVESSGEGILLIDETDGTILTANSAAAKLYGTTRDRLFAMPVRELLGDQEIRAVVERQRHHRVDGTPIDVEVLASPCDFGGRRCTILTVRDITDRLRAEERERRLEARLAATQRLESLELLAGGVAHDFNNLLFVIRANAEALRRKGLGGTTEADNISLAADRAADLTRQLLSYAGRIPTTEEAVDLGTLTRETVSLLEKRWNGEAARVRVEVEAAPDLPRVWGDVTQYRQLVMNLFTNAREALADRIDGRVKIRVIARRWTAAELAEGVGAVAPPEGTYVSLSVTDNGPGIAPERVERIFDPFFTTKPDGRGLGLAIVLGVVQRHGGVIRVRSALGQGTSFHVALPVAKRQGSGVRGQGSG